MLGRPAQAVNEIIKGKKAITPETAIGLEKVLGISAQFWTNLEANYRLTLARNPKQEASADDLQWLNDYPIKEMVKRGWIEAASNKIEKLTALLTFLGADTAEPRTVQEAVGFRITESAQQNISPGALVVWLRKGEMKAQERHTADYNEDAFKEALTRIRQMTEQLPSEFIPAMTALCADAGVAFCLVQELPKSGANGVTRWLDPPKALIQMSIRSKWADIFWFTFFHEACHLLHHMKQRQIMIDGVGIDPDMAIIEKEADGFARDFLISPDDWSLFCNKGCFTPDSVREFAQSIGIAPFIVVGRLQKEGRIPYSRLANLKHRYQWSTEASS